MASPETLEPARASWQGLAERGFGFCTAAIAFRPAGANSNKVIQINVIDSRDAILT
jgi:hypothetical protein